jgi:hypothetical protein
MITKMICIDEHNFAAGVMAATVFFVFCRLISEIYKTNYYYVPIFIVYVINTYYHDIHTYNPFVVMLNACSFIWLLCFIDKIANSVLSNILFTLVVIYTLTIIN